MKKLGVIILSTMFSVGSAWAQAETDVEVTETVNETVTETATEDSYNVPSSSVENPLIYGAFYGDNGGYNPLSVRPIHESDIMWKKTLLRALDLREKQNLPMFSRNKEITRLIIDAVKNGDLTPYQNDSLINKLTIDEFNEKLKMPDESGITQEDIEMALMNGDSSLLNMQVNYYFPTDLYQMELKEDMIFDKNRSRLYYDIIAVSFYIPADHPSNIKGIQEILASFSYKELTEKVFKNNPKAIWFNVQNDQQHKNLADAFDLRLFSSYIIKVSNPYDAYIVDIYGGDQNKGIMASRWAAMELLEFEHHLWEF